MRQGVEERSEELLSRLLSRKFDVDVVSEDSPQLVLQEPGLVGGAQHHDAMVHVRWIPHSWVWRVECRQACLEQKQRKQLVRLLLSDCCDSVNNSFSEDKN